MAKIITDCLVLKLEEYDIPSNILDNTLYVIYDKKEKNYIVRGKRFSTLKTPSCSYSFICENTKDLAFFISYIIDYNNNVNEILYNYDNLPYDSKDITFDFLNESDDKNYEISGYNNVIFCKKKLLKNLKMLKNVFNYYN
jgi:hypothetical protein